MRFAVKLFFQENIFPTLVILLPVHSGVESNQYCARPAKVPSDWCGVLRLAFPPVKILRDISSLVIMEDDRSRENPHSSHSYHYVHSKTRQI